ncbi:ABC transporter substrate-binding protein [Lachnotalea glycerini]|uniref:ABC transporter substrate-binding protein n=1 Tax=Lachnotalea glycerini TaxID=1763509 RepID=A0A371JG30_9FIRM|nr:ABC transporter substrate-binding protein [Lachnotalea glycerini]RDY31637.1 ABC transporter substrate-binding protein [Lachnotalea glycerini]
MKKRILLLGLLFVAGIFSLIGCGGKEKVKIAETTETPETKILKVSEAFSIENLNPHQDYQGWYTSIYGLTQSLFQINEQSAVVPVLAENAEVEGNVWTITIKEAASFSNGTPVTSEMVIRNLQKAGTMNARFTYFTKYTYEVVDDKTFKIVTGEPYPTLLNDLASPELAIVDLDESGDMATQLVATGPFVVSTFEPGGTITVEKNQQYWDGAVQLDGAEFYYMPESSTSLLAMQNGEIDTYTSVTADAVKTLEQEQDRYQLSTVSATRLQFYILNQNRLSDSVRKAINLTVDSSDIEKYLNGSVSATVGPFSSKAAYGQVTKDSVDINAAKLLLEEEGYILNSSGYYEKDGQVLTVNVAYYAARSLDTVAALMQEQLKEIGIKAELTLEEDPDATYIQTGDFDIGLYCMIADKAGDPYYFISCTLAQDAPYNCGGFSNQEAQHLIEELQYEADVEKRAELANQIIQIAIDENAFGYIALFNKTTAMVTGVSNVNENSPFDFYFLNAETNME